MRGDTETLLYRAAEQGPERPLALTFKPVGDTDGERAQAIETMWRSTRRAAEELSVVAVTITASGLPDLPAAVEVAAYRIVTEALANVARHSTSPSATVRLDAEDTGLRL